MYFGTLIQIFVVMLPEVHPIANRQAVSEAVPLVTRKGLRAIFRSLKVVLGALLAKRGALSYGTMAHKPLCLFPIVVLFQLSGDERKGFRESRCVA